MQSSSSVKCLGLSILDLTDSSLIRDPLTHPLMLDIYSNAPTIPFGLFRNLYIELDAETILN